MVPTPKLPVILYQYVSFNSEDEAILMHFLSYDASPFATKVKNLLTIKQIHHSRVEVSTSYPPITCKDLQHILEQVSNMLPRPDLSDRLGVTYRRIPVLAIGRDVYCDTSIIAAVLERRFPSSEGYPTLFPARKGGGKADTGMVKALSMSYADRAIFPLAAENLPYAKFTPEFVNDRSSV